MSLTQTYYIASAARTKLAKEANRADHNLRRLVAHANTLDALMIDLAEAEREQEAWFNTAVRTASKPEEPRRVKFLDQVAEEYEEDDSDDESDDGSDIDEEELYSIPPPKSIRRAPVAVSRSELEADEFEDEDSDDETLALTRVDSYPPELTQDSDSEDEDDMPGSPEDTMLEMSEKQRQAITTTAFFDIKSQRRLDDFVMEESQQTLIAAAC